MSEQKRAHFRLQYPVASRPKITIRNETLDIIDISEMGVRFGVRNASTWKGLTEVMQATITFADGEKVAVLGKILRVSADQIVLHLTRGIPYAKIMSEQRRILQSHKTLKS